MAIKTIEILAMVATIMESSTIITTTIMVITIIIRIIDKTIIKTKTNKIGTRIQSTRPSLVQTTHKVS
jgi:hypothetical protein